MRTNGVRESGMLVAAEAGGGIAARDRLRVDQGQVGIFPLGQLEAAVVMARETTARRAGRHLVMAMGAVHPLRMLCVLEQHRPPALP